MAKETECGKCDSYKAGICTKLWAEPSFDGSACELIASSTPPCEKAEQMQEDADSEPARKIRRRGSSAAGHSAKVVMGQENSSVSDRGSINHRTLYVGEKTFSSLPYIWYAVLLCFLLVIGAVGWYGWRYYEKVKMEELSLEICGSLQLFRDNPFISYLQIQEMGLDDNSFYVGLRFPEANAYNPLANCSVAKYLEGDSASDKFMRECFLSLMTVYPSNWDCVCHLLDSANLDLSLRYSQLSDTCVISHSELLAMAPGTRAFREGEALFIDFKKADVLNYAQCHFKKDCFFSPDSVSLTSNTVTLHLNYDDTYPLGNSFTDVEHIAGHFTDPVGDMGSIADNMLTICSLKKCGMAIEYFGRKSHKIKRWEWDANRTQDFLSDYQGYIPYSGRQKNQVQTVIVNTKNR